MWENDHKRNYFDNFFLGNEVSCGGKITEQDIMHIQ